jgi:hypothetical protein
LGQFFCLEFGSWLIEEESWIWIYVGSFPIPSIHPSFIHRILRNRGTFLNDDFGVTGYTNAWALGIWQ